MRIWYFRIQCDANGNQNSSACFQRFIVETFNEFIDQKVLQYLDDFIVNTRTIEEHQDVCKRLFNKLITAKIKCADKKSKILTKKVEFLGNTISDNEIYPNNGRARSIINKPRPTNLQELQAWLGAANYLRKYINDYAQVVQPLYNLMQLKNIPEYLRKRNGAPNGRKVIIEWTESTDRCFNNLKQILCSEFVLSLPDFEQEMIITTDASDNSYGAVLEQHIRTKDGSFNKKPIEYFSKSYTPAQKNYSTT